MKTRWLTSALFALLAFSAGRLGAQNPVGRSPGVLPPAYSPYLNLLRNNNPAYVNYYGLVRPEVDFRSSINGLQQGVAANAAGVSGLDASGLLLTGHPTSFMNTSHYFFNRGGQATPGAAAPGAAMNRAGRRSRVRRRDQPRGNTGDPPALMAPLSLPIAAEVRTSGQAGKTPKSFFMEDSRGQNSYESRPAGIGGRPVALPGAACLRRVSALWLPKLVPAAAAVAAGRQSLFRLQ